MISYFQGLFEFASQGRTTDEGWSIYKEDELGIRDDGGGKQTLVPHVVDSHFGWNQTHLSAPSIAIAVSFSPSQKGG